MKLDMFNVRARFWQAQALLNMGLIEEARQNLLATICFDPNNEELKKELARIEELCSISCKTEPPVIKKGLDQIANPITPPK